MWIQPSVTSSIRLGTRASQLARTQSALVGEALTAVSQRPWREVLVKTIGDDTSKPLSQPGSPGLFVSALRRALLAGEVDVIVHSYKDLPSAPEPGITIAAVPGRADSRDALVSRDNLRFTELPPDSIVGTSSPRRTAALQRMRSDLVYIPIRGNIDTRISKVRAGDVDAVVLAVAGLTRIGRTADIAEIFDNLLSAPAQGALAVECRENDEVMLELVASLDDAEARLTTTAERHVLVGINASCTTALAALATYKSGRLHLRAELTIDGHHTIADIVDDCSPNDLTRSRLLGLRACALLVRSERPVLLIRSEGNQPDAESLNDYGIASISEPFVLITPALISTDATALVASLRECAADPHLAKRTWLVATSPMTVPSWLTAAGAMDLSTAVVEAAAAGVRAAATGARTASTLRDLGFSDVRVPKEASAQGLIDSLSTVTPGRALFPRGDLSLRTLPDGLRGLGWDVNEGVVYQTTTIAERPVSAELIEQGLISAIVVRSPSTVRALLTHARVPDSVPVVCAGRTTANAALDAGLSVAAVAASPSSAHVAHAVAALLGSASNIQ